VGSAALAGAAFIVGVVVGWLLRASRRAEDPPALEPVVPQVPLRARGPAAADRRNAPEIVPAVAVAAPPLTSAVSAMAPEIAAVPAAQAVQAVPATAGVKRKERETTVLVCGFGSAATGADVPANVLRCLTDLQNVLSGIVGDEGGTVDRFAGDRLVAMFAAKRRSSDHAGRAVEAAKRIASNVGALSHRLHYDLRIAIGIHTGCLPADERGHIEAGAIGDAIDVAGRLEVYASESHVAIALTESVAEAAEAGGTSFELMGEAAVGSEGLPMRVFTPRA
jgi:class 3 adenylate cyclase